MSNTKSRTSTVSLAVLFPDEIIFMNLPGKVVLKYTKNPEYSPGTNVLFKDHVKSPTYSHELR